MSKYNHPNINAVGLTVKIIQAIEVGLDRYKRGKAGDEETRKLLFLLKEPIEKFVNDISEELDNYFGTHHPDDEYFNKWLVKKELNE